MKKQVLISLSLIAIMSGLSSWAYDVSNNPDDETGMVSIDQLEQQKKQVEVDIKQSGDERFKLSEELKAVQDEISSYNQHMDDVESQCLVSLHTAIPEWCPSELDKMKGQGDALNERESGHREKIEEKTQAVDQLNHQHNDLVHQEYKLKQQASSNTPE